MAAETKNINMVSESCKLPMLVGHCRGYQERWFYDHGDGACEPFGFSGCGGNANNFRSEALCKKNCVNRNSADKATTPIHTTPATTAANESPTTKKWKPTPSSQDNEVMVNDAPMLEEDADCQTGPWLGWSECFGDCEYAVKLNYRLAVRAPRGGGRACGPMVKSHACRPAYCRHIDIGSATTTPAPEDDFYTIDEF